MPRKATQRHVPDKLRLKRPIVPSSALTAVATQTRRRLHTRHVPDTLVHIFATRRRDDGFTSTYHCHGLPADCPAFPQPLQFSQHGFIDVTRSPATCLLSFGLLASQRTSPWWPSRYMASIFSRPKRSETRDEIDSCAAPLQKHGHPVESRCNIQRQAQTDRHRH